MPETRSFKFIAAPPERSMRRRSPASAPRLFEWLVENEYAEEVSTVNKRGRGGTGSSSDSGRIGAKKRKKKKPF